MEQCKDDQGSGSLIDVGMVIGGRAARACDVCCKERAHWYCAADLAYLCDRCDGSVHSANAVARRHERAQLGPNGEPLKVTQKLSTPSVKRDVAAAGPFSAANLSPRKKPRSIRRHKPSSMQASKNGIRSSHTPNHINSSPTSCNTGLMYAPNYSIMINNPRNDLDYIDNSNFELSNKLAVIKPEPLSPAAVDDQVKVPDHTDDDPLFEALFDFRDLQDDDLFLQQVPIYNPLHNQHDSPALDTKPCVDPVLDTTSCVDNQEIKPAIIHEIECKELGFSNSSCASVPPSELPQAELGSNDVPVGRDVEDREIFPIGKCDEPDRFVDSGNTLCDLDQLDFDSMLHGHDEDGDEESHASHISPNFQRHVHSGYMDASNCHIAGEDSGSHGEDSCARHGNGMDAEDFDDSSYNAVEQAAGYGEAFDFDVMGTESPRSWLCKVKVERPEDLELDGTLKERVTGTQSGFKLGLKLNFEDVLHAWSDRGTFWMDGIPPPQINSCLDFLGGGWLVPEMMSSTSTSEGDGQQLVPVLNQKSKNGDGGAREASVLRYREKRRTRLFCKKIRYEVRKLNAEKRPRMKGRFVKRISIVV